MLLSNTFEKKNFKKLIFSWATGCLYFFLTNNLLVHFPSFHRWWLVLILKIMLYNYLGAGYEVRLTISLSGDFEPMKSDLRRLQFCISGLVGHK